MLDSSEVVAVYKQVLGREPSSGEVDDQLRACSRLEDLLRIVLESEEYAAQQLRADVESARAPTPAQLLPPGPGGLGPPPGHAVRGRGRDRRP